MGFSHDRSQEGSGIGKNGGRRDNFTDGVLPISAPVDWFGKDGWHDVVVRFADAVVELYVDGVLIDEEFTGVLLLLSSGRRSVFGDRRSGAFPIRRVR